MLKEIYTLVADFSVQGNLAYLSHQETLKMFQQGFIRASVPLVYSNGFNPHPHISLPFPRSVGTCSDGDRLCATIEFSGKPSAETLSTAIGRQLPEGCAIQSLQCLSGKVAFYPGSVHYQFRLKSGVLQSLSARLESCREQIQKGVSIQIQRYWAKKRRYKMFDIADFLQTLAFERDCIDICCTVSQSGTVRVDELMGWLGLDSGNLREPVCRTGICWNQN